MLERNLTVQIKVTQFSCKTQIHTGLMSDGLEGWKYGIESSFPLDVCFCSEATGLLCPFEGRASVDPADGNPLRLCE